jgi:hypothetical protein
VIGDPVNVAARVESATREMDEDVLITERTAEALSGAVEVRDCGERELKGVPEAMKLFVPRIGEAESLRAGEEPLPVPADAEDGRPGELSGTRGELGGASRGRGIAQL